MPDYNSDDIPDRAVLVESPNGISVTVVDARDGSTLSVMDFFGQGWTALSITPMEVDGEYFVSVQSVNDATGDIHNEIRDLAAGVLLE